jgi:hypothetical protein
VPKMEGPSGRPIYYNSDLSQVAMVVPSEALECPSTIIGVPAGVKFIVHLNGADLLALVARHLAEVGQRQMEEAANDINRAVLDMLGYPESEWALLAGGAHHGG